MMSEKENIMPQGCVLLKGKTIADERGMLTFVEGCTLPFEIKRMFWITSVPEGKTRGGHAHAVCSEAVFAVSGSFCIHLSDGENNVALKISSPNEGVLVPAGIWCDLKEFSEDCVCVVAASHPYDSNGYINTYESYLEYRKRR